MQGKSWALVLAAGEGSRLKDLTRDTAGNAVPKQFCSLQGDTTLLQDALVRGRAVADRETMCAVVASGHRQWWSQALAELPDANVVVQPMNRGTANGVLLPLLHVLRRDPRARLVLLPSDHYVRDERVLAAALQGATDLCVERMDRIVLLGMQPDEADPELGYIVPGDDMSRLPARPVRRFTEKPAPAVARSLLTAGALWNIFIVVARAQALLDLYVRRYPEIVMEMLGVLESTGDSPRLSPAMIGLYDRLPTLDFSRHVLEGSESQLDVVAVPSCGWSDLGTPRRVIATVRRLGCGRRPAAGTGRAAPVNLAARVMPAAGTYFNPE